MLDIGTKPETHITIETPVIGMRKSEIVQRGVELGAPLHLTWSCYQESELACGNCDSCALRLRAFREAGMSIRYPTCLTVVVLLIKFRTLFQANIITTGKECGRILRISSQRAARTGWRNL